MQHEPSNLLMTAEVVIFAHATTLIDLPIAQTGNSLHDGRAVTLYQSRDLLVSANRFAARPRRFGTDIYYHSPSLRHRKPMRHRPRDVRKLAPVTERIVSHIKDTQNNAPRRKIYHPAGPG